MSVGGIVWLLVVWAFLVGRTKGGSWDSLAMWSLVYVWLGTRFLEHPHRGCF